MLEDTRQTGVYRIRCTANAKVYVGSAAVSFRERWNEHASDLRNNRHHSKRLQNAWNKYGPFCFVFEVVERTDPRHAVAVEQTFLDFWKAADKRHGFNIRPRADSALGMKRSDESKEKIARKLRGVPHTPERRANISKSRKGIKASPETKAKMSLARTGKKHTPETRQRMSVAQTGRTFTEESHIKMSIAQQSIVGEKRAEINAKISAANSNPSPEKRERMSLGQTGRKATPETKAKMSDSHKGLKHTTESKEKIRIGQNNRPPISEETRQKQRVSQQRRWERHRAAKASAELEASNANT